MEKMNDYAPHASWAVWETDESGALTGSMGFPFGAELEALHGRAMLVGMNKTTKDDTPPPWTNFHSAEKKHNDRFLAAAFVGTPYWGAYMTDLHPGIRETDSRLVRPERDLVEASVGSLIERATILGEVDTVVAIGAYAHRKLLDHANSIEKAIGVKRSSLIRITHYSGMAAGKHGNDPAAYRELVHRDLGLLTTMGEDDIHA